MTEIEKKALALVNEVVRERHGVLWARADLDRRCTSHEALCRAIEQHEAEKAARAAEREQHEAFRQEVSDSLEHYLDQWRHSTPRREVFSCQFGSFILPKPDPLVEAREEAKTQGVTAACIHERPTSEELRLMKGAAYFVLERFEQALAARGLKIVEDK